MQQTVVILVEPRGGYTAQIIAISQKIVVLSKCQRQCCFRKAAKICHYGKYLLQGFPWQNIYPPGCDWRRVSKHCLSQILSCDARRLLNAAIPSKAIANAGLSRHRHSPARGLLKCLVLPAGFAAKHILYYVQERKIMNLKPSGSRGDNNSSSGGRIDPNINETDTAVLINITAMTMII